MAIQSSAKKSRENAHKNYTNLYSFDIIFTLFIINIFIASLNNIEKRREEKRREEKRREEKRREELFFFHGEGASKRIALL